MRKKKKQKRVLTASAIYPGLLIDKARNEYWDKDGKKRVNVDSVVSYGVSGGVSDYDSPVKYPYAPPYSGGGYHGMGGVKWWEKQKDLTDEIDDIVNPYVVRDELTEQYLENFARILSPRFRAIILKGETWGKSWKPKAIRYPTSIKMRKVQAQAALIRAISSLEHGERPMLSMFGKVKWVVKSNTPLNQSVDPFDTMPLASVIDRYGATVFNRVHVTAVEEYLRRVAELLDERRTVRLTTDKLRGGKRLLNALASLDKSQTKQRQKAFVKILDTIREDKNANIKDIFERLCSVDNSKSSLINEEETRERIRSVLMSIVFDTFVLGLTPDRRTWIPEMKAALSGMEKHRPDLARVKTTRGVVSVVKRMYEDGLHELLKGTSKIPEESQCGGGLTQDSLASGDRAKKLTVASPNYSVRAHLNRASQLSAESGVAVKSLRERLSTTVREFFLRNARVAHVGRYRSGKPIKRRLYRHRLGDVKLMGRRILEDEKKYHLLIAVDVSGSTGSRFGHGLSILNIELAVIQGLIDATKGYAQFKFTIIPFNQEPMVLCQDANHDEAEHALNKTHMPTGGGTSIARALKSIVPRMTANTENLAFVLTDGYDHAPSVRPAWTELNRVANAWAFTLKLDEAPTVNTFGDLNNSLVESLEEFNVKFRYALSKMLRGTVT